MALPERMKFGIFMAPFHWQNENPTVAYERDFELIEWLDYLDFDEAWIGEHHSADCESRRKRGDDDDGFAHSVYLAYSR